VAERSANFGSRSLAVGTTFRNSRPADPFLVTKTRFGMPRGCERAASKTEVLSMSTNALTGNRVSTIREWKSYPLAEHTSSISAMISVNADRHRIYQALTVPEYIEAWFSAPGAIAGRTEVSGGENSFSISYWCAHHKQFRILCSYRVCRRSKLVFAWQHFTLPEVTSSMVKIRLLGDFGRTTVHVTHVGLTPSEQQWHECLWAVSLGRLRKLF